ncbi:hypothetical protein [Aeromonas salmonicida]
MSASNSTLDLVQGVAPAPLARHPSVTREPVWGRCFLNRCSLNGTN